jgi:predicted molibdopterin-dependent oxidoreductase YjgC
VLEATGLPREEIEAVHEQVLRSRSIIVCWAMGLTQHEHGVPTICELVNFLMLRGQHRQAERRPAGPRPDRTGRPGVPRL